MPTPTRSTATTIDLHRSAGWDELLESVPLAALLLSPEGEVLAVNREWTRLSGLDERASKRSGWTRVVVPDAVARLRERLTQAADTETVQTHECQLVVGSSPRWTRWWWRRRIDGNLVVCVADIDADKAREQELWSRATHDSLTGLTNRSEFLRFVAQALRRAQRSGRPPAVLYVDLDGFKAVNDQGGHHLGDQVLRAVGERLPLAVRPNDVAGRVGGDEFAVLCEDLAGTEDAILIAERIRSVLREPIMVSGVTSRVSATTGLAFAADVDEPEALLARADADMYAAKEARRTQADHASAERPPPARADLWPYTTARSPVDDGGNPVPERGEQP